MVTITDFMKMAEKVNEYEKILSKEYHNDKENFDYRKYNALMYQIANAYESLEKGLKGEF